MNLQVFIINVAGEDTIESACCKKQTQFQDSLVWGGDDANKDLKV